MPGGWDVEVNTRILTIPNITSLPETAAEAMQNVAELDAYIEEIERSKQLCRELGVAGLSEQDAQGVIHRLLTYEQ